MNKLKLFIISFLIIFLLYGVMAFSMGKFTVDQVNVCGDEVVRELEECDGGNLTGQSCLTLGYSAGVLGCTSECTFDESLCETDSGNGGESGDGGSDGGDTLEETIRECNDRIDNDGDGRIDFPEDLGCTNTLDDSEVDIICEQDFQIGEWGECVSEVEIRRTIDVNHCKSDYISIEERECFGVIEKKTEEFSENKPSYFIFTLIVFFVIVFTLLRREKFFKRKRKKR